MIPFDDHPNLEDDRYRMRPLASTDKAALYRAASDPEIWKVHPSRDRWKPEVFGPYFEFLLNAGGTRVLIDKQSEQVIGCSRYYPTPDIANSISIGFTFVARTYWGGETNRAMKSLMLAHAFRSFDEVWLHIGPDNIRSQKATLKLGAEYRYDADLDVGAGITAMKCYCLTRAVWMSRQ